MGARRWFYSLVCSWFFTWCSRACAYLADHNLGAPAALSEVSPARSPEVERCRGREAGEQAQGDEFCTGTDRPAWTAFHHACAATSSGRCFGRMKSARLQGFWRILHICLSMLSVVFGLTLIKLDEYSFAHTSVVRQRSSNGVWLLLSWSSSSFLLFFEC